LEGSDIFAGVEAKHCHLVTTYFDTQDQGLNEAGLILRVRRSNGTFVQTVKSRANHREVASNRHEWQWQIGRNRPDVGKLAETHALAKFARVVEGKLAPVFVTDIRRTTRLLDLPEGTTVEAAIDEGSIKAGSACESVGELELELKSGRIEHAYRLARELQALAPLWISPESKGARGWHLHTGQTEGVQDLRIPDLARGGLAANGLRDIVAAQLGHLVANIAPSLRGNADGVHQMRTALRGSRASLKLFAPQLDAPTVKRFDAALQRFARIFGTARDWDVFCMQTLPAAVAELPAGRLWDLQQGAEVARTHSHHKTLDTIRGQPFTALLLGLAVWTEAGVAHPDTLGGIAMGGRLSHLAPSLLDRAAGQAKRRGHHVGRDSPEQLHSLRKSLDRLCDDIASLSRLYDRDEVKRYRDRCETVQAILGIANDAVMARQIARKLAAGRPDLAKPAKMLVQWSDRRRRKTLLGLTDALQAFRTMPEFWR
jgi:inorganic triphosphatase YgiF